LIYKSLSQFLAKTKIGSNIIVKSPNFRSKPFFVKNIKYPIQLYSLNKKRKEGET